VACPNRLTNRTDILVLALELKGRAARDDTQIGYLGENRGDFLGYAVREEILAWVVRDVGKRKHRDGHGSRLRGLLPRDPRNNQR